MADVSSATPRPAGVLGWLLLVLLIPLLPILLAGLLLRLVWRLLVQGLFWARHSRHVILVYSDSPKWQQHIEQQVIPKLPPGSVVLNWSHRATWPRWSLSAHAIRQVAGEREYCPMALVFRRGQSVQVFRFFQAFKDARHGNTAPLLQLQAQLLQSWGAGH